MTASRTPAAAGLLAVLALLVAALVGCDDAARTPEDRSDEVVGVTDELCRTVLDDAVMTALGWSADSAASSHVGRCQRRAGTSSLTVGLRPVPATEAERAGKAQDAYDEACAGLGSAAGDVQPVVDWITVEGEACARLPKPGQDVGSVDVFVLTTDDRLLQVQLAVLRPTPADRLQDGINRIAVAADQRL